MNELNLESWVHPAIFSSVPVGLIVLDNHGVVTEANPTARSMFDSCILGQNWERAVRSVLPAGALSGSGSVLQAGHIFKFDACPLPDGSGSLLVIAEQAIGSARKRESVDEMENRNFRQIASGLVHELRTPLTTAMLLADRLQESSGSRQAATRLEGQLSRIESKVNDLLLLARGGQLLHDFTDVGALQETCQNEVRQNREWKDISFLWSCEPSVAALSLKCNLVSLRSAVHNLIATACESGARRILIDFHHKAGNLVICVIDDGAGVVPVSAGTGVQGRQTAESPGLPLVEAVAHSHLGYLELSARPEAGARACLVLPLGGGRQSDNSQEVRCH
ncbi:histidine kinase dimerization/phospho-acceptor domain-containing protein [Endozoicomonadaceae bacterium StTr2]